MGKHGNYAKLKQKYLAQFAELHYSPKSIEVIERNLRRLDAFMEKRKNKTYTAGVGKAFLADNTEKSIWIREELARTVRRLDELVRCGSFELYTRRKVFRCNAYCQKHIDDYAEHLKHRGLRGNSIKSYCGYMSRVLQYFYSRGIRNLADIAPTDIYAAFEATGSKIQFTTVARNFFRYLYKTGQHSANLSHIVPTVRKFWAVPSVYTRTETEKMLLSIDRSTSIGKRDYAAVLIALRLGMRGGDITKLKVSDVNFADNTIEFMQEKTLVSQKLELLPEIAESIAEYLATRRNPDGSDFIFLTSRAPYRPMLGNAAGQAVAKYLRIAGIDAGGRRRGSHAMRSTLASELASEDVPYDVIRRILGQENPESVKHYIKLDIEKLRRCALDAPAPTGMLAEKLLLAGGGIL